MSVCKYARPNIKQILPSGKGWCMTCDGLVTPDGVEAMIDSQMERRRKKGGHPGWADYDALRAELAALKATLPCGHPKSMDDSYGGCVWCKTMHTLTTLEDEYDALKAAAAKVVERWDTPAWKEAEPTATVINDLRALLGSGT